MEPLITERKQEPIVWPDAKPLEFDYSTTLQSHHKEHHKANVR